MIRRLWARFLAWWREDWNGLSIDLVRTPGLSVGIEYDRRPSPEWQRQLAYIAPRSDKLNWLYLYWEPGEPWEPVERWVVGEVISREVLASSHDFQRRWGYADELFSELEGPNPRSRAHSLNRGKRELVYDGPPPLITRRQWELYRRVGGLVIPIWIVQGHTGGHKRWYSPAERKRLRFMGWPHADAPAPGELAFSDFDLRAVEQLWRMDKLRRWAKALDWHKRTMKDAWKDRAADEAAFETVFGKWLDDQIREAAAFAAETLSLSDLPVRDFDEDPDEARTRFEQGGVMTKVSD